MTKVELKQNMCNCRYKGHVWPDKSECVATNLDLWQESPMIPGQLCVLIHYTIPRTVKLEHVRIFLSSSNEWSVDHCTNIHNDGDDDDGNDDDDDDEVSHSKFRVAS